LVPMLRPPRPCRFHTTRPTPGVPPARQLEVRTERRERQELSTARTTATSRRLQPRPNPTERPPLNHRVRVSLAKRGGGERDPCALRLDSTRPPSAVFPEVDEVG